MSVIHFVKEDVLGLENEAKLKWDFSSVNSGWQLSWIGLLLCPSKPLLGQRTEKPTPSEFITFIYLYSYCNVQKSMHMNEITVNHFQKLKNAMVLKEVI